MYDFPTNVKEPTWFQILIWPVFSLAVQALSPILCNGTLLTVIPTKDGVVVGADTKTIVLHQSFKGEPKLRFVHGLPEFGYGMTGEPSYYAIPPSFVTDLAEWVSKSPKLWDGYQVVADELRNRHPEVLNNLLLREIGQTLLISLDSFLNSPGIGRTSLLDRIFQVVIFQYNAWTKTTRVGCILMRKDSNQILQVEITPVRQYRPGEYFDRLSYGETDYLERFVLAGPGKAFLLPGVQALLDPRAGRKVKDVDPLMATLMISSIVQATEMMSYAEPINYPVGGLPEIFLLDGIHDAKRLHSH